MENNSSEIQKTANLGIMELTNMIAVPMALNAVARLNVAEAIWQSGVNAPLSSTEILSHILPYGGGGAENLERILSLLSSYNVFSQHLDADSGEKKYSLTEIGKTLVSDSDGNSWAPYVLHRFLDPIMSTWPLVHETVLDPTTVPFVKLHGEEAYNYYSKRPEMNELVQKGMAGFSASFMKALLKNYNGFEGVKVLVDVGGSGGDCLKMILRKYPTIEAINFDLPNVIENAPIIPGVTHIGGDMMKCDIPSADAIFIKMVLPTCTDNECKAVMKNCYKALAPGGKLIVCDPILPPNCDFDSHRTRAHLEADVYIMTVYNTKGKQRSEEDYKQLSELVGFSGFKVAYNIDHFIAVVEFFK